MKIRLIRLTLLSATVAAGVLNTAVAATVSNATLNVYNSSTCPYPLDWNDTRAWTSGVPADGAGSTLTILVNGDSPPRGFYLDMTRDVTLGHIVRPSDDTQGESFSSSEQWDCLMIRWDQLYEQVLDSYTPHDTYWGRSVTACPYKLTFDSGDANTAASIRHVVTPSSMAGKRFGLFIEPPIVLNSDLYVKYLGPSDCMYGTGWSSANLASHADCAVYLTGGISDGANGSKGLTVDNPVYQVGSDYVYIPIFLGGTGTFTGDVTVKAGMLRLLGEGRFEGDCHSIGAENHIYATTGEGVLDLAGTRAGLDGNTLHLGGKLARSVMGTLINSNPDPLVPAEWAGPIVIESATAIGGYSANPSGVNIGGGSIVLSGAISGSADVDLINRREIVLSGDNSNFSGNWNLKSGYLRLQGPNPVGKGTLKFTSGLENYYYRTYGTIYRYGSTNDVDLTTVKYDIKDQNLCIDVAEGLEYHPVNSFVGLTCSNRTDAGGYVHGVIQKTGPGTLRLTEVNEYLGTRANYDWSDWLDIDEGEVILDYTDNHEPKLIGSKTSSNWEGNVYFGENTRLTIKGTPREGLTESSGIGFYYYTVQPNSFATICFDDEGQSPSGGYWLQYGSFESGYYGQNTMQGVMNLVFDESKWKLRSGSANACRIGDGNQHNANYPSIRNGGEICNSTTFTYAASDNDKWWIHPVPDSMYVKNFTSTSTGATGPSNSLVDVTAALCNAGTHANIECAALRFNTPNGTTPLVLNLSGTNRIHSGTILITPNMGKTPVIIRGGLIARESLCLTGLNTGYNEIRIINMNTNATLTIESDLCLDQDDDCGDLCRGQLGVFGPGRTICTGRLTSQGTICVNGGTLAIDDNEKFLASRRAPGAQWDFTHYKWRETYLYGGGVLEFINGGTNTAPVPGDYVTEESSYHPEAYGKIFNVTNQWRFHIGVSGGGLGVGKDATFTITMPPSWCVEWYAQPGAKFIKDGAGTLAYHSNMNWQKDSYSVGSGAKIWDWVNEFDLRGGTIGNFTQPASNGQNCPRFFFGGACATVLTARDGTRMAGGEFSNPRTCDTNRETIDSGYGHRIVIPEGATVTYDRYLTYSRYPGTAQFESLEWLPSGLRTGGIWAGGGTLVITNSISEASMAWCGFRNRLFTGVLDDYLGTGTKTVSAGQESYHYDGYPPNFDYARLYLNAGTCWYMGYGQDANGLLKFRLGGLDGDGTLACKSRWQTGLESPRIGSDDGLAHDFSGLLAINRNAGFYGQFTKVGSNTQRISGTTNDVRTSAKVVDGTLVLGQIRALDCQDLPKFCNNIYVGGDETTDGMSPRFLVDCGNVTISNLVRVLGCPGESAPAVGTLTGDVTFRNVTVSNAYTLVAEAGSTARFSNLVQLGGVYPFLQTGAGTVEVLNDLEMNGGCGLDWGGQLYIAGTLTVDEGTTFDLWGIPSELDPSKTYMLLQATGGISGKFDFSGTTVPKGWTFQQLSKSVVLRKNSGFVVIFH